ncbi:hypothetical protein J4479_05870 [Candidatus Woesearchaeota archaeon]|nr:hypothetical protein [Candidatus Woesearchaeota archaeon]
MKKVWKNNKTYHCRNNEPAAFLKELLVEEFAGQQTFLHAAAEITGINIYTLQQRSLELIFTRCSRDHWN